jgi:hypothetical protein
MVFINANKPSFILNELSQDPDPYLEPVLTEMRIAVEDFANQDFASAEYHFGCASNILDVIVNPEV